MDRAFNPQCIAVVGDKNEFRWIHANKAFKGKLYSVQISPEAIRAIEALGVKNYTSLLDIPDPVDLAVVCVPRAAAPRIVEDCIHKGVAGAHFYTSGFSETGTEEGKELESRLVKMAKEADFNLIGPNCLGIFNPKLGVRQTEGQYIDSAGPVGFISQSGAHAVRFSMEAHYQGVDINKSVSFGNGRVLDSADYLEYFGNDADIRVIGMYLEGVREGRRFLTMLKEVSARKPVVIWKGGRTEEGGRAIASHTGSLAISQTIWDTAIRQCGAVKVRNMEELIDTLEALLYLSPVRGNRAGIAGGSGGQSVAITDAFAEAGLNVPLLTQKSYDEFATFFNLVGASYRNPIDTGMFNRGAMKRILEILERDANIDNLVFLLRAGGPGATYEEIEMAVIETRKKTTKPMLVILPISSTPEEMERARQAGKRLRDSGLPSFYTLERGARALKNTVDYYSFRNNIE